MSDETTIFRDQRRWQWLLLAVLAGGLIWLLGPILTPFVISALLAWLGDPLVARLERAGRSRAVAVGLVFLFMILMLVLALLILVPLLSSQIEKLIDWLPQLAGWISFTAIPWLESKLGVKLAGYVDPDYLVGLLKAHWQQAGGIAATVLGGLSKSGLAILGWVANIVLIPVLTFYFLRDWRTQEKTEMDRHLFDILWEVYRDVDGKQPINIISSYRSPATNTMLHSRSSGVAEHSQHLLGKAIDLRLSGFSTQRLAEYARSLGRGGVGFYAKSDFVHVDTGRVRFW